MFTFLCLALNETSMHINPSVEIEVIQLCVTQSFTLVTLNLPREKKIKGEVDNSSLMKLYESEWTQCDIGKDLFKED